MRKIYTTLLAATLALTGLNTAKAQKTYYDVSPDPVTEIEAGQNYVISICYGSSGGQKLLYPEGHTSQASESTVYQFEQVGTNAAGDKTWHIKNVSTGFYIQDPDLDNTKVSYTASPARAFTCTAKQIVWSSSWSSTGGSDPTTYSYGTGNASYPIYDNAFVFCNVNYSTSSYKWFCLYNNNTGGWAQYATANSYLVYPLVEASASNSFVYSYDELFGSTKTPATLFSAGTKPGQVPQEIFDALQKVYDEATTLYNGGETVSDDAYRDLQKRMEEAYDAAKAARLPLTPGYYIIYNSQSSRANGQGAIYDDGSALYWEQFVYNDSTELTLDGAKHLWKVEAAEGTDNFTFQNVQTGRYFGTTTATSTAVPTSATTAKVFNVVHQESNAFSIDGNFNGAYTSLHAQQTGQSVVIWTATAGASGWTFEPVSAEEISALDEQIAQKKRNEEAVTLVEEAKVLQHNGIVFKSDASRDGLYGNLGLAADSTHFWSNACETSEGSLAGLVDNNQTTYFHSTWSDASYAGIVHYLGVDLGEAVQYVDFKYSRRNSNAAGTPKTIHLYASNDTTSAASWVDQGLYELSYDYAANETYTTNPTLASFTGIKAFSLDAPYRYLRLDVEHTLSDAKSNYGCLYFVLSEARFYKGAYDAENSPIEAVPDDVKQQLATAIATVENEMNEGDVSEASFNALKKAIEDFNASFPDASALNDLIDEAKAQLEAAEEGEDLGYFKTGAKATLQSGISEVEGLVKALMSAKEIVDATAKIKEVIATFNASLNTPADGDFITIMSATTGDAANSYLYAAASSEKVIKWGGYDSETGTDENLSTRLNYIWKVTKNDDGSFTLRNVGTGMYYGNPKTNDVSVLASAEPDSVTLRSAKVVGLFNIVLADGIYSNAQPNTNNLVSWGTASGTDNSAFKFSVVTEEWSEGYHYDLAAEAQLVTLPLEITADPAGATLYGVLGVNGNTVQLKAYETGDKIAAGQAFIYVPNADNEAAYTDFYPTAGSLSEIELDMTPKTADGLVGVLLPATPGAGYGMLYNGKVINTSAEDEIAANTGYFVNTLPVTEETGAYSLPLEGTLTGIANAIIDNAETVNVYTTSGVLVRKGVKRADALNGLPAGLYIAGSKKALVK